MLRFPEAGVPNAGVTNVGLSANTNAPEPVSSLIMPANCDEVVAAKAPKWLVVYTPLVTVAALPVVF